MHNKGALLYTITVLHFKKRQFFFYTHGMFGRPFQVTFRAL